ncbi:MAG: Lrp/AsnC family transcriptional regulator [Tagaea sp. CACIAM 22H2]|nr:Lrp/AsnC family transcriptional regulator [Tagaea sp. CACIAM 22H2]
MDDIDRKILAHLQLNGRDSYADIGKSVGLSVSAVNDRLKKLIATGAIQRFAALVDPAAVGCRLLAFVSVLLERPEHDKPFLAAIADLADVQECHHVTGDWSYLLKIRVADTAALERVISDKIKTLPGVARSQTVIALSSAKDDPALACLPAGVS